MYRAVWLCAVCAAAGVAGVAGVDGVARALAAGGVFRAESTVLVSAEERRGGELGYRLAGELTVAPRPDPAAPADLLLHFRLAGARLLVRGAARAAEWEPRASTWDGEQRAWAARLSGGAVRALYLHPDDSPDVANYKRALASLFQFQEAPAAAANETDASGDCAVEYEALGDGSYRKIKRRCAADELQGGGAAVAARRAAVYSLDAGGALLALHAEDVLEVRADAAPAALLARSWLELERRAGAPAPPAPPAPLAGLREDALTLHAAPDDEHDELLAGHAAARDLNEAIERDRAALEGEEAGAGGTAAAAAALLRLLPALEAAPADALRAALERAEHRPLLVGLARAVGLAGTRAAVRAAAGALQLVDADPPEAAARAFLAGFALAARPSAEAVREVARLAGEARRGGVAEAALLAAGAAAARLEAGPRAAVRDELARALARCRDECCRAARLAALGHLREEALEPLLRHAERDGARVAGAALAALRGVALGPAALARLGGVAANASAALETRAAALELVAARRAAALDGAVPLQLLELALTLQAERSSAAHELRRVLWQRLDALGATPPVRELRRVLPPALRTWDARAPAGTSSVLSRAAGWAGWAGARLDSVQLARGGVLRRGAVALEAGEAAPLLLVEVWLRGLAALAGQAGAEGEEGEEASGALALTVAGARLPDVPLFDGQAQLLSLVWSGAGSAPTRVLRAAVPAGGARGAVPLLGGAVVRVRARAAAALALDARGAASLWHRTARAALALRAARAARLALAVRTEWGSLAAARTVSAEPRLRLALDLDFYDGVALCVRAAVPEHELASRAELRSELGARRLRVRRAARSALPAPGRTLALGRLNDAACRLLRAGEGEDDDE